MAPPAGTLRVGRYFLALFLLFAVLYGVVFLPGKGHTPKLGLDLVGGAQVVLQASTTNGGAPTKDAMNEARTIIEDRVNGRGVANSQVQIEGTDRITVTIPGKRADDISDIGQTALLEFRPVVAGPFPATAPAATPTTSGSPAATPSASTGGTPTDTGGATVSNTSPATSGAPTTASGSGASPQGAAAAPIADETTPSSAAAPTDTAAAPTDTAAAPTDSAAAPTDSAAAPAPAPSGAGTPAATNTGIAPVPSASSVTGDQAAAFQQQNTSVNGAAALTLPQVQALIAFQCGKTKPSTDTSVPIVTCSEDGSAKYVLAPVLFPGTDVGNAQAVAPSSQNVQWSVQLSLKGAARGIWADYTAKHNSGGVQTGDTDPSHYVAFTLDGTVITAPNINGAITGDTTITGQFDQTSATNLANSLKYGALPLSFKELTSQTVSATLGTTQLKAGLLAGGIGLALVVIYSLLYYRGLGLVTLASLVVSGGIVYASLVILGRNIGFTLTLAGVAGFIVAVGITADSFVVFFERIKDEVHEGRSMRVAVPRAWIRARRTVISADIVSLLAALVLYFLAAGDVRGFAFTLGLSTVIDLIVVFWFTHPLVSLLSRSRAFGSRRFTGLDAVRASTGPAPKPVAGARPARPGRAAKAAGRPAGAGTPSGGVAVLEREDDDVQATAEDVHRVMPTDPVDAVAGPPPAVPLDTPADTSADTSADSPAEDADLAETGDTDGPAPAAPRRRRGDATTGSAAERAAARRAKLRAEKEGGQ